MNPNEALEGAKRVVERSREFLQKPTEVQVFDRYRKNGIKTVVGVPCSITDTMLQYASQLNDQEAINLIMTTNEHNLGPIAMGIYLTSGEISLMHMQNSGMTNAGDAFISMMDEEVYGIPGEVLVTWRGANERDDSEPHQAIGRRMERLASAIYSPDGKGKNIFGSKWGGRILSSIDRAHEVAQNGGIGVVLLSPDAFTKSVKLQLPPRGEFDIAAKEQREREIYETKGNLSNPIMQEEDISRDEMIARVRREHPNAIIFWSNGYMARAAESVSGSELDFPNVGGMGTTLAIGWGAAKANPNLEVVVVDGDQNAQMSNMTQDHLPANYPENLYYYIADNGIGASVGTSKSLELNLSHYKIARVVRTIPDDPGSFKYVRVGKGKYDDDQDYLESQIGPLRYMTKRFMTAAQRQTRENISRSSIH